MRKKLTFLIVYGTFGGMMQINQRFGESGRGKNQITVIYTHHSWWNAIVCVVYIVYHLLLIQWSASTRRVRAASLGWRETRRGVANEIGETEQIAREGQIRSRPFEQEAGNSQSGRNHILLWINFKWIFDVYRIPIRNENCWKDYNA